MDFDKAVVDRVVARQGRLHAYDEIEARSTAFVVIDMQNYFTQPGYQAETPASRGTFAAINRLATAVRDHGGLVIWVQTSSEDAEIRWSHWHDRMMLPERRARRLAELHPAHSGHALADGLQVDESDVRVSKCSYSALTPLADDAPSELATVMRDRGVTTVLIGGTATNVCCESTARDAMMMNYQTIMVDDALSASTEAEHVHALANWIMHFGDVLTSAEIAALLR